MNLVAPTLTLERHRSVRIGWLRAAVLGANDGIVSTASLIVGVAAANTGQHSIAIAGVAGLVAGAMSMAAGEYVSVSSQSDTEQADLATERRELANNPEFELHELAQLYVSRGVELELARKVSEQLMLKDAIGIHALEELGNSDINAARPVQAAFASAGSFSVGAAMPLAMIFIVPSNMLIFVVFASTLIFLGILGSLAAQAGGASLLRGAVRVIFWGMLAMAVTAGIGALFGTTV
jgi:VIT1/CCC1 family predicted Fe2+/Mn2+ transporter